MLCMQTFMGKAQSCIYIYASNDHDILSSLMQVKGYCLMRTHLPRCADKGKTVFGNLCALQRQASHFLSVLQASRHPAAPPVGSAAAPQDEHAVEEKTVKQMAERIIQTHKYGTLTSIKSCHLCTSDAPRRQKGDTGLQPLIWYACKAPAVEDGNIHGFTAAMHAN